MLSTQTKFFFGLGNKGNEYQYTRHNAGKQFIKFIEDNLPPHFSCTQHKIKGQLISKVIMDTQPVYLYVEDSYMNNSGNHLLKVMRFLKLTPDQLYLCYDDLDIELGKFKISIGQTPKLHNGVDSVIKNLGTNQFHNIRIGIDSRKNYEYRIPGEKFVLQNFTAEENEQLIASFSNLYKLLLT